MWLWVWNHLQCGHKYLIPFDLVRKPTCRWDFFNLKKVLEISEEIYFRIKFSSQSLLYKIYWKVTTFRGSFWAFIHFLHLMCIQQRCCYCLYPVAIVQSVHLELQDTFQLDSRSQEPLGLWLLDFGWLSWITDKWTLRCRFLLKWARTDIFWICKKF